MSSKVINFMDRKSPDINILIEDFTDEFYECETLQVKHWLITNSDHTGLSSEQINQLSINQLKYLFIDASLSMLAESTD